MMMISHRSTLSLPPLLFFVGGGMVFGSSHLALGSSFNCSSNKLTHPGRPAIIPAKLGVSLVVVVGVDIVRSVDLVLRVVDKSCC
jgi:hypothetical protein